MLHNTPGYLKGKKGAYIIDYYGGHYYVDMKAKFATSIYDLDDQPWKRKPVYKEVDLAPDFASWKNYKEEIPFKRESVDRSKKKELNERERLNEIDVVAWWPVIWGLLPYALQLFGYGVNRLGAAVNKAGSIVKQYLKDSENKGRYMVQLWKKAMANQALRKAAREKDMATFEKEWNKTYNRKESQFLKDLLDGKRPRVSEATVNGDFDGEPDTGYLPKGQARKLGTHAGKPEDWFEGGGYEQLDFPVADDIFGPGSEPDLQVTKTTTPSDESLVKEAIKKTSRKGNPIPAQATSLNDFIKHIKSLPEGPWDELRYPIEAKVFNPKRYSLKNKPLTSSEKAKFIKAITNITKVNEKKGTPIYSWEIDGGPIRAFDTPDEYAGGGFYYVNLRSKSSDEFARDMGSGKYGSLD